MILGAHPIATQSQRAQGPGTFQPLHLSRPVTHSRYEPLRVPHDLFNDQPEGRSRLLRGALLGAAAGLVVCTIISNAFEDEGDFQVCPGKGVRRFVLGGAVVGASVAHFTE